MIAPMLLMLPLSATAQSMDELPLTASVTIEDMHSAYSSIFASGNRNAASHLWASWILGRSSRLTAAEVTTLFSGFCPVSGSPVSPTQYNAYHYTLPLLGGAEASGLMHHCCSPCVCDTHDKIKADTKTLELANGKTQQLVFAVIGDPCTHPEQLERPFNDPFSGGSTTLTAHAPEVSCDAAGRLRGATFSDHGAVIIGLLSPAPAGALGPPPADPTPGRAITLGGTTFQDSREFAGTCRERAASGYNSGMGLIFRLVADVNPLASSSSSPATTITTTTTSSSSSSSSSSSNSNSNNSYS
jgi:hypothetical protein